MRSWVHQANVKRVPPCLCGNGLYRGHGRDPYHDHDLSSVNDHESDFVHGAYVLLVMLTFDANETCSLNVSVFSENAAKSMNTNVYALFRK